MNGSCTTPLFNASSTNGTTSAWTSLQPSRTADCSFVAPEGPRGRTHMAMAFTSPGQVTCAMPSPLHSSPPASLMQDPMGPSYSDTGSSVVALSVLVDRPPPTLCLHTPLLLHTPGPHASSGLALTSQPGPLYLTAWFLDGA